MKIRADFAHLIALRAEQGNPILCRRTGNPIYPGMKWDLGHAEGTAVAQIGDNTHNLAPELTTPNRSAGGKLGHQLHTPLQPSRTW